MSDRAAASDSAHARGRAIERDVVKVSGPDAVSYLQGQISQDVDALGVATSTWTFVLQPTGKVDVWARITRTASDEFVLDTDAGGGVALETRLRRFLMRTKADIEVLDWAAVAVRGADAPRDQVPDGVLRLPVIGPGVEGYDLLGPGAALPDGVAEASDAWLEADRIAHGVPRQGVDIDDKVIPAEIGSWAIQESVSFTKGCFVGQELTARIDSRGGNVPRHLRVLRADGPLTVGASIDAPGPAAVVTSVSASDRWGTIALAFLGRAVSPGDEVRVGSVTATVSDVPLA